MFCMEPWSRGQKNEQLSDSLNPKKQTAAGYQGPVKIERLLKGAGLLRLKTEPQQSPTAWTVQNKKAV